MVKIDAFCWLNMFFIISCCFKFDKIMYHFKWLVIKNQLSGVGKSINFYLQVHLCRGTYKLF